MWIRTVNGIVFVEVKRTEQGIYYPTGNIIKGKTNFQTINNYR
jgi:hypothetical protein